MDARARLLGGETPREKKRQEGASQRKLCLRFLPLPDNSAFNDGMWLSLPYPSLRSIAGTLDFSTIVVEYVSHRVTIHGHNLRPLADRIDAGRAGDVIELDPLHAARRLPGAESLHEVTLSVRGADLPSVLAAVETVRGCVVESVQEVNPLSSVLAGMPDLVTKVECRRLSEQEE